MTAALACRLCNEPLPPEGELHYRNMPRAAQFLPAASDLAAEHGIDLDVTQCQFCGLVQLLSPPVTYYRQVVRATGISDEMRSFRLDQFRRFAARHALLERKVLEVGCGQGDFLTLLRQAGMDAWGLEYASASVMASRDAGLPVHRGFIDGPDTRLPGAPYHGFFTFSFLEHLPNPLATLRGIFTHLAAGATGLVEVPNFDMIVKNGLFAEFIADHLTYFTRDTLARMLQLTGFDIIEIQSVWHDYILSATVTKRKATNLRQLDRFRQRTAHQVDEFLDAVAPGRVAIWGAGHQALTLINLLSLEKRVSYVVDSAPFKQNRFTPGSHLPIMAPATLKADPVAAVMVIAGSYSSEVVSTLRRLHDPALRVAVLGDDGVRLA